MNDLEFKYIFCDKSHNSQNCRFSKNALTKLKMLATLGTISAITVVTFSGCANIKKDLEQTTITVPETSYVQMMEATTTTIPATQPTTKKVIETTIKVPTTIPQNVTEEKTTKMEPKQDNITTTIKQIETTNQENIDNEYNKLLIQLNNKLSKKSFSDEVNKLFLETFESLYNNYLGWQKGYNNLPSREDYIKDNLIDVIEKIEKINFYKRDSKEANDILDEGLPSAWMELDENNQITVNIICEPSDTKNTEERSEDIENFFHEIIHCKESNITLNSEYFDDNIDLEQIFTEGRSNFPYEIYKTIN